MASEARWAPTRQQKLCTIQQLHATTLIWWLRWTLMVDDVMDECDSVRWMEPWQQKGYNDNTVRDGGKKPNVELKQSFTWMEVRGGWRVTGRLAHFLQWQLWIYVHTTICDTSFIYCGANLGWMLQMFIFLNRAMRDIFVYVTFTWCLHDINRES